MFNTNQNLQPNTPQFINQDQINPDQECTKCSKKLIPTNPDQVSRVDSTIVSICREHNSRHLYHIKCLKEQAEQTNTCSKCGKDFQSNVLTDILLPSLQKKEEREKDDLKEVEDNSHLIKYLDPKQYGNETAKLAQTAIIKSIKNGSMDNYIKDHIYDVHNLKKHLLDTKKLGNNFVDIVKGRIIELIKNGSLDFSLSRLVNFEIFGNKVAQVASDKLIQFIKKGNRDRYLNFLIDLNGCLSNTKDFGHNNPFIPEICKAAINRMLKIFIPDQSFVKQLLKSAKCDINLLPPFFNGSSINLAVAACKQIIKLINNWEMDINTGVLFNFINVRVDCLNDYSPSTPNLSDDDLTIFEEFIDELLESLQINKKHILYEKDNPFVLLIQDAALNRLKVFIQIGCFDDYLEDILIGLSVKKDENSDSTTATLIKPIQDRYPEVIKNGSFDDYMLQTFIRNINFYGEKAAKAACDHLVEKIKNGEKDHKLLNMVKSLNPKYIDNFKLNKQYIQSVLHAVQERAQELSTQSNLERQEITIDRQKAINYLNN